MLLQFFRRWKFCAAGQRKHIIERMLPLATMYIHIVDGQCRHVLRYDKKFCFGLLYSGSVDSVYLNRWMERVMLNFGGESLGAYPISDAREVWYLSDRRQWDNAAKAFEQNEHILIAFPLYVESIPGILLEFLSGLHPRQTSGTKLAFLIQGGFPEASQSRCCEAFLETLPVQLGFRKKLDARPYESSLRHPI